MLKSSVGKQAPRSTILALAAVAALGGALVIATDASARGFGGGGGFAGHSFGGGGFGGHGFGGGVASRGIVGGFAGHNVGFHAVAPSFNRSQRLAPSGLRGRNVGHNVMPVDRASTTASKHVRPLPATPAEPQVPAVLSPKTPPRLIQPPFGSNHIPPPNSGPQPVKPSPVGPVPPPPLHVKPSPVGPAPPPPLHVKPSPVGPVPPPPLHVLPGQPLPTPPAPGHAQPIAPPPPVNPTPVNPPSNSGRPDIGATGPTIAVGVLGDDAVIEAPVVDASLPGPTCNRILRNGCYFAMRKFSTSNGAELRCTMFCE